MHVLFKDLDWRKRLMVLVTFIERAWFMDLWTLKLPCAFSCWIISMIPIILNFFVIIFIKYSVDENSAKNFNYKRYENMIFFFFINPKNIISKYKMLLAVLLKIRKYAKNHAVKIFNCIFKFLTELPIILLSDVHTFFTNKYFIFAINVLIDADLFVCSDNNGSLSSDCFLSIRRELFTTWKVAE